MPDQRLADQDRVGARIGHAARVRGREDARLGHLDGVGGEQSGHTREARDIDAQVAQVAVVHADELRADVDRAPGLVGGVHLDQRRQSQTQGQGVQGGQGRIVQGRHDEQDEVGARRARLPDLVGLDDEVLAEHRDPHRGPDGGQVLQRTPEPAPLGEHGDGGRPAGLVLESQRGWILDGRERALAGARALHLGDHGQAVAAQPRQGVEGRGGRRHGSLQLFLRHPIHASGQVGADPEDDVVQDRHAYCP